MRQPLFSITAIGVFAVMFCTGCPWSSSPDLFESSKGISLPRFGGPPPQTEPDVEFEEVSPASKTINFDSE